MINKRTFNFNLIKNFNFCNNAKYYIAVTKPNGDIFCLNCFSNFQNEKLIKNKKFCKNVDNFDKVLPKKVQNSIE